MARRSLQEVIATIPSAIRWKLDQEIDFENRNISGQMIPKHLGGIADSMTEWEGTVADCLGLSLPDRHDIKENNPNKPKLQR